MARRYLTPISGRLLGACLATWLLASSLGSAALASSSVPPSCEDEASIALKIPASQLLAADVSHEFDEKNAADQRAVDGEDRIAPARFLTPEAKAALRRVFDETDETVAEPQADEEAAADSDKPPMIKTRVPGITDGQLARYKRHMYRRDI